MSRFDDIAASVRGAVLDEFGDAVEVFDTQNVLVCQARCTEHRKLIEQDEMNRIHKEEVVLRFPMEVAHLLKSGYTVDFGDRQVKLTRRELNSELSRQAKIDDHWSNWYTRSA